jgi:uncharacterized membrane protein
MKLTKWLYSTAATVAAGFVATAVVKVVWRLVSGDRAPSDPEDPAASTLQATLFAAVVAAAVAVAQTLAGRRALDALREAEAKDLGT